MNQPTLDGTYPTSITISVTIPFDPTTGPEKYDELAVGDEISFSGRAEIVKVGTQKTDLGPRPYATGKGIEGRITKHRRDE